MNGQKGTSIMNENLDLFASPSGGEPLSEDISVSSEDTSASSVPAQNIFDAFAYFLRVEVANGNATDDTVDAYYREVAAWVKWCQVRRVAPESVERYHVEAFREEMKRRGLALATRAHKLSIIRRFYESAIHAGLREDNPVEKVWAGRDLTQPEEKLKVLSESALSALVDSLPINGLSGHRDRLIVALMAAHGLRRVEIHRLNHEDIDGDLLSSGAGSLFSRWQGTQNPACLPSPRHLG